MGLRILSLFDGMSCGMLAMIAAEIEVEIYDAYEIDKYAITASKHNFPQIEVIAHLIRGAMANL